MIMNHNPAVTAAARLSAAACMLLAGACSNGGQTPGQDKGPRAVESAVVARSDFKETVRGVGTLRALQTIEIRAERSGTVERFHVREGARVEAGQTLLTLDDDKPRRELQERRNALAEAEVRLGYAENHFARIEELSAGGVAPPERLDRARSELKAGRAEVGRLKAAVALAREHLDDTRICAPADGVLSERLVDPGDFLTRGQHILTLYVTAAIEMECTVPERYMGRLHAGQPAAVTTAACSGRPFAGTVSFVSPDIDPRTRDMLVKVKIDNREQLLKPGAFGAAEVTLDVHAGSSSVPEESLVAGRGGYSVFVIRDGAVERRKVETGLRRAGFVEIRNGLDPGETVVRTGHMHLSDGDPVSIIENGGDNRTMPDNAGKAGAA